MVSSKNIISAITLYSAFAVAAPTSANTFSIHQVAVPKKARPVVADYARALRKYQATVPQHVAAAAVSCSAANNPVNGDVEYITQVTAGNSKLNLDFDTGSADLYAPTFKKLTID
jgi:aspergillopepsin I